MSVPVASLGWGVVQDDTGNALPAIGYSITELDDTPVATGVTNTRGEIPGNIAVGVYKLTILGRTMVVHAVDANDPRFPTIAEKATFVNIPTADERSSIPTAGQKAALAGTAGTPSDTNRYVTSSDSRLSSVSAASYVVTVGNGVATQFDIPHSLNTTNILPFVRDTATGEAVPGIGFFVLNASTVRIITDFPPANGALTVVIMAGSTSMPAAAPNVYSAVVGDGVATQFVIPHGLGTREVFVGVRRTLTPFDEPEVEKEHTDNNTVTIRTPTAVPAVGELAVIVMAGVGAVQGAPSQHASQHLPGVGADAIHLPLITSAAQLAALPVADKQEVRFLADQTNGVIWHLRYRAFQADGVTPNPSAYKWEVVGGRPLASFAGGGSTTQTSQPTVIGASIVVPLAGDYDFDFAFREINNTTASAYAYAGYMLSTQTGAWALYDYVAHREVAAGGSQIVGGGGFSRRAGVAAGATFRNGLMASAGTAIADGCMLRAMPVRVG